MVVVTSVALYIFVNFILSTKICFLRPQPILCNMIYFLLFEFLNLIFFYHPVPRDLGIFLKKHNSVKSVPIRSYSDPILIDSYSDRF